MSDFFNCKVNYLKQAEDGSIFKKSENYILNALSHTEAEARLQAALEDYIPEYNLQTCAKTNICDVIIDETCDVFFKLKVSYISFDEDSGKEKKISENYVVQAKDLLDAYEKMHQRLKGSIVDWEIPSITKTTIVEVFPYFEDVKKEAWPEKSEDVEKVVS